MPLTTAVDWTFGWTGRLQFVAVTQRGDDADNGIEADNNEFNNNVLPRSNPQIYNITMCGDPDRNEGGESPRGANLRRGTAFTIRNFLITGFKTTGSRSATRATVTQVDNGTSQMGAGVAWNIGRHRRRSGSADACERAGVHQQRSLPEHPDERRSRASRRRPAQTTRHRTSNHHRSRHWLVVSWRPSCRPTTAFSR